MRSQDHFPELGMVRRIHEKGFPFVSGRMVGRHVEGLESEPVPFDFRLTGPMKPNSAEDLLDLSDGLTGQMEMAGGRLDAGHGGVDSLRLGHG